MIEKMYQVLKKNHIVTALITESDVLTYETFKKPAYITSTPELSALAVGMN